MKINEKIKIIGQKVVLIPYESKHVEKYHRWMKSPELQELTASEPLSLEDEYEMQKTWRNDENKCTFLILSKDCYDLTKDEIGSLVGDTNLFLELSDDGSKIGEAEIMIAEESYRRQGLGWESMLLMLKYGQKQLNIKKFTAKIGEANLKSINMFQKMKFAEISRSPVFKEVTLEKVVSHEWISWLDDQVKLNLEIYT